MEGCCKQLHPWTVLYILPNPAFRLTCSVVLIIHTVFPYRKKKNCNGTCELPTMGKDVDTKQKLATPTSSLVHPNSVFKLIILALLFQHIQSVFHWKKLCSIYSLKTHLGALNYGYETHSCQGHIQLTCVTSSWPVCKYRILPSVVVNCFHSFMLVG